ncbi:MAG: flippase [Desulfobaccales bacterium]
MENPGNGITPKRFVRNSILLVTIEIVAKGLGVVFFVMVARFLGAKELGLYAFSLAVATFVALPTKFGFETIIQREVGRDPINTHRYFWGIITVKVLIAATSWGIFLLVLMFFPRSEFTVMAIAGGFALVYSFMEFTNAFFRANQRPEIEMVVRLVFSVGNLALGTLVLYSGWRLTGVLSAQLVAVALAVTVGALILMHISTKVKLFWNRRILWGYVVNAAPFGGILLALFLSNQIGVIILTPWAGKEDVGYFAAALRLFDPVTLIPAAIMGAFLPMMSGLHIQSLGKFVRTLRFTMKFMFILAVPLVIITSILAHQIVVFLYRESFAPSAQALQILSAVIFFSFWNYTSESVLIARNQERILLKLTWITAGVHVAANLILIPKFSYLGACLAILTTQVIYSMMLFILQMRRYLSLVKLIQIIARPALCAAITALAVFMMRNQYVLLSITAGLAVYMGTLFAFGAVKRSEFDFIHGNIKN